jgi:hypothetical protein
LGLANSFFLDFLASGITSFASGLSVFSGLADFFYAKALSPTIISSCLWYSLSAAYFSAATLLF